MGMPVQVGMKGQAAVTVDQSNTAAALGSGAVPSFGTPALVALVERAAVNAIRHHLEEGQETVGVQVSLRHTAPTPVGKRVRAEATVTAVDGRKIAFSVTAADSSGPVGDGTHERVVIDREQFIWKLATRGAS
jgi:fluoroacetyl-CoA thioesterase